MTDSTETIKRCVAPEAVRESDIPAYVEGQPRPEFTSHVQSCPFCQEEAADYRALSNLLDNRLGRKVAPNRANCPPPERLGEYSLKLLDGKQRRDVRSHLDTCRFCRAELALLEGQLIEEATLPSLAGLVEAALRKVRAALVIAPAQPGLALRSGILLDPELEEAQRFEAEDVTVLVQAVKGRRQTFTLSGMVMREGRKPHELAELEVQVRSGERMLATQRLDESGNFYFEKVGPTGDGDLTIEISFEDKIVIVPHQ